jgi:hypothetical protein
VEGEFGSRVKRRTWQEWDITIKVAISREKIERVEGEQKVWWLDGGFWVTWWLRVT